MLCVHGNPLYMAIITIVFGKFSQTYQLQSNQYIFKKANLNVLYVYGDIIFCVIDKLYQCINSINIWNKFLVYFSSFFAEKIFFDILPTFYIREDGMTGLLIRYNKHGCLLVCLF